MSCQTTIELLPWLLNGSLEPEEREAVRSHVSGCETCRAELAETAAVWEMFDAHIPAWDLAAYAAGLFSTEWSQEDIHRHLGVCSRCRSELAGVEGSLGARPEPVRRPSRPWKSALALAAVVLVAILLGFWAGRFDVKPGTPTPGVQQATEGAVAGRDSVLYSDSFEAGTITGWSIVQLAPSTDSPDRPAKRASDPNQPSLDKRPAKEM